MRTISEIYDEMCAAFVQNEVVQQRYNLTPGQSFAQQFSNVSIEAALFMSVSVCIWTLEKLFGAHVKWINKRAVEIRNGNTFYYRSIALEYQEGYELVFDNNLEVYKYSTNDDDAKIIKYAAAVETNTGVTIKVAKDQGGEPEPLTEQEQDVFAEYMRLRKFAGVKLLIVSRVPDLCKLYYRVWYNPLVMNPDGSLISNPAVKPVELAITNELKNLEFNGVLSVTALTDKIQSAEGVINPVFLNGSAKYGDLPYFVLTDFYTPNAGYMRIDPAFPLESTIEYIPYQI